MRKQRIYFKNTSVLMAPMNVSSGYNSNSLIRLPFDLLPRPLNELPNTPTIFHKRHVTDGNDKAQLQCAVNK